MPKCLKKNNGKKIFIVTIFLTLLFLLTFILGLVPVYPFGTYEMIGDVVGSKLTLLTKIPIYPLILFFGFLDKISIPEGKIELFYFIYYWKILIIY